MKKFHSEIEKDDFGLKVAFNYERIVTEEDEKEFRDYLHYRAKKKNPGIDRQSINVSPRAGEVVDTKTVFSVQLGNDLYLGLNRVYREAEYTFSLLIRDLLDYSGRNPDAEELVQHAIQGLVKIVLEEARR